MLRPQKEKVFIDKLNSEIVFNFFTLADDNWITQELGDDVDKKFKALDVDVVLKLTWRLLSDESKQAIKELDVFEWAEMEKVKLETKDPVEKMKSVISGTNEFILIYKAILATREKSDPPKKDDNQKKSQEESH